MPISSGRPQFGCLLALVMMLSASFSRGQAQPQAPLDSQPPDDASRATNGLAPPSSPVTGESAYKPSAETRDGNPSSQELASPSRPTPASASGDYILSSGDTIDLVVYREPDLNLRSKIGDDGLVQLPLLGEIKLAGLSVRSASTLIRQKYDADYLVNPQIYLDVVSYHPCKFSVGGQVGHPGSYDFGGGDAPGLMDAIGMAGGFLSSADRGNIIVKRRDGVTVETIKLNAKNLADTAAEQFKVQPGDDINVGEGKFTIIGQVGRPGTYDFGSSDTLDLLEAIGMAGGFTRIADRGHIAIKRKEGEMVRTLKVNAKKFNDDDQSYHFEIMPGDVINVGESWY